MLAAFWFTQTWYIFECENYRSVFTILCCPSTVVKINLGIFVCSILVRSMQYSYNNFNFNKIRLNTIYNNETTFLWNYFESMSYLAFKFDAVVMALSHNIKDDLLIDDALQNTVQLYSSVAFILSQKYKSNLSNYYYICRKLSNCVSRKIADELTECIFSKKLFRKIGYAAFRNVLKKRNERYKNILMKVKQRIKNIYFMNYGSIYEGRFEKIPNCFNNIRKYVILSFKYR